MSCLRVEFEFAETVAHVQEQGFEEGGFLDAVETRVPQIKTKHKGAFKRTTGVSVVMLAIERDADLMVDSRVAGMLVRGLSEAEQGGVQVISPQVFHTNVDIGLVAARKQSSG